MMMCRGSHGMGYPECKVLHEHFYGMMLGPFVESHHTDRNDVTSVREKDQQDL